jgi:hypothetical protein
LRSRSASENSFTKLRFTFLLQERVLIVKSGLGEENKTRGKVGGKGGEREMDCTWFCWNRNHGFNSKEPQPFSLPLPIPEWPQG